MPSDPANTPESHSWETSAAAVRVEGGATVEDGTLRLWRAREVYRQTEALIAAQTATMDQMRTRSASLLTWNVGALLGLLAAHGSLPALEIIPAFTLFSIAALACIFAQWPTKWAHGFWVFSEVTNRHYSAELFEVEATAQNLEDCVILNDRQLALFVRFLKIAWLAFAAAPASSLLMAFLAAK